MSSHRIDDKSPSPDGPSELPPIFVDGEEPDSVVPGAVQEALRGTPPGKTSPLRAALLVAGAVLAIMLLTGYLAYLSLHGSTDHANRRADHADSVATSALDQANQANAAAQTNKQVSDKLSKQLLQHGISPSATAVPVPSAVNGLPGPTGPPGPAPSFASIVTAVSAYCNSTGVCAGKGPTQSQVIAAVTTYCSGGQCRGAPGPSGSSVTGPPGQPGQTVTGPPGANGANGTNGADAPPPSADQLKAAVGQYCADNPDKCQGPPGPAGPTGPTGPPGTDCPNQMTVTPNPLDNPNTPYVVCVPSQ